VLGLAAIPTLLGHTSVQTASRHLPPTVVALVSPGETLGGLAIAAVFMGASPTPIEAIGAGLIVLGETISIAGASVTRALSER
jgi:drug/metabolite transporter (DMT)-like permease